MEPNLTFNFPGCRGVCRQGRSACPCPEECAPDGPPLTRTGCLIVLAAGVLGWAAVGVLIWIVVVV